MKAKTMLSLAMVVLTSACAHGFVQPNVSKDAEVEDIMNIEPDVSYAAYVDRMDRVWLKECGQVEWSGYLSMVKTRRNWALYCLRGLAPAFTPELESTLTFKQSQAAARALRHAEQVAFEIKKAPENTPLLMKTFGQNYEGMVAIPHDLKAAL